MLEELNNALNKVCERFSQTFFYNYFLINQLRLTGIRYAELDYSKYSKVDETTYLLQCVKHSEQRIFNISEFDETFLYLLQNEDKRSKVNCYSALIEQFKISSKGNFFKLEKKYINLHIFRHLYIKNLFAETQNVNYVQSKIGHKNVNQTMSYILSNIHIVK